MQCDFPLDWTNTRRSLTQSGNNTTVQFQSSTQDTIMSDLENQDDGFFQVAESKIEKNPVKAKGKKRKDLAQCSNGSDSQHSEAPAKRIYTKKRVSSVNFENSNDDDGHTRENTTAVLDTNTHLASLERLSENKKKNFTCTSLSREKQESSTCATQNYDGIHTKSFLNPIGNKTQMHERKLTHNVVLDDENAKQVFLTKTSAGLTVFAQSSAANSFSGEIRDLILKQLSLCIRSSQALQDIDKKHQALQSLEPQIATEPDLFTQVLDMEEQTYLKHKKNDLDQFLDTDSLISKLPYKKMLLDIFGGNLRGNLQMMDIPYVTRVYEESFMREPLNSSERECAKGKLCECMFIDKKHPFVGVEFLLPGEKQQRTSNMCVLCYRQMTQQLYYDVIFDKCEFPGCIQKFGNIHSEKGEYLLDAMLIAAPTAPSHVMPVPIVSHQRNRYNVYVSGGIKRLSQSRVYFQNTPSYLTDLGM